MISLILSLAVSIAIGYLLVLAGVPAKVGKVAETVSQASIYLLIFLLGARIGSDSRILSEISSIGFNALLLALAGTSGSVLAGWILYRFLYGKPSRTGLEDSTRRKVGIDKGTLLTVASLLAGLVAGAAGLYVCLERVPGDPALVLLYVLLASVGLGVGMRPGLGAILKGLRPSILLLPLLSILFTLVFCAAASTLIKSYGLWDCLAVGSGMGYYSLSSVLIANLKEASCGVTYATSLAAVALLSNIFRELLTLVFTPLMASRLGPFAPVAAAGATSMDVCLPGILKSCGQEFLPATLVSGILTDFSVPFLVSFFCSL
ncbi:MAG: lysine exporter LysO family protein [Candidatus Cryptobacteroides sp.]